MSFLEEDLPFGDLTSEILPDKNIIAYIENLEPCVIAGIEFTRILLNRLGIEYEVHVNDGDEIPEKTKIITLKGNCKKIFEIERAVLNLLMHLSGIATKTRRLVRIAREINPKVKISATRKTIPGLRYFEKKAVEIGGGDTHRYSLSDMVLIKKNHVKIFESIEKAVEYFKSKVSFSKKIEIEVSDVEDAIKAAKLGIDIVMLDNMKPDEVKKVIEILKKLRLRDKVLIEVSGGIDEHNIIEYVKAEPDIISTSAITMKAKPIDMHLVVEKVIE